MSGPISISPRSPGSQGKVAALRTISPMPNTTETIAHPSPSPLRRRHRCAPEDQSGPEKHVPGHIEPEVNHAQPPQQRLSCLLVKPAGDLADPCVDCELNDEHSQDGGEPCDRKDEGETVSSTLALCCYETIEAVGVDDAQDGPRAANDQCTTQAASRDGAAQWRGSSRPQPSPPQFHCLPRGHDLSSLRPPTTSAELDKLLARRQHTKRLCDRPIGECLDLHAPRMTATERFSPPQRPHCHTHLFLDGHCLTEQ